MCALGLKLPRMQCLLNINLIITHNAVSSLHKMLLSNGINQDNAYCITYNLAEIYANSIKNNEA